jgi:NADPH2:quinone reductase
MQAVVYRDYGDCDVLQYVEIATPASNSAKVMIKVHAASVNPIDYRLRRGEMRWLLPGGFPRVPGYDIAGVIIHAPPNSGMEPGDRVMAFLDNMFGGGYAQYASCSPSCVAKIGDEMSWEEAAAIPLAASTSLQSLRDHGRIKTGGRVLINGASGGVGAFAVQIAKAYGAGVTGVASGKNESFVRSLGADDFIDYTTTDFTETGETWDLIFDAAGKSGYRQSCRVLCKGGRYVSTEPSFKGFMISLITKLSPKRGKVMLAKPRGEDLRELIKLYEKDLLKVTIDDVFPLEEAAAAHRRIEAGVDRGKIVLRIP